MPSFIFGVFSIITLHIDTVIPKTGIHQLNPTISDLERIKRLDQKDQPLHLFEEALNGSCGDNVFWKYKNTTLIIYGSGQMNNFSSQKSPPYSQTYQKYSPITYTYQFITIDEVIIEDGVTSIGKYAFYYSWNSNFTIRIPNTVAFIGSHSFSSSGVSAVTIEKGVIEDNVFYRSSKLQTVIIGNEVTFIGESSFWMCETLESVTLGNHLTSIELDTFRYCNSLTSIIIPGSVKYIREWAFSDCKKLASVTLEDGIQSIYDYAFYSCSITSIILPASITKLSGYIFCDCLGDTNPKYDGNPFDGCKQLSEIIVPSNYKSSTFCGYKTNKEITEKSSKLSTGVIIGIVIGVLMFIGVVVGIIIFLKHKYQKKEEPSPLSDLCLVGA